MAALGLAAAQFLTHDLVPGIPLTRGLAIVLVGFGVFVALAGARRYLVTEKRIDCGEYRPARTSVVVASILVALVGGLSVLFITLIPR